MGFAPVVGSAERKPLQIRVKVAVSYELWGVVDHQIARFSSYLPLPREPLVLPSLLRSFVWKGGSSLPLFFFYSSVLRSKNLEGEAWIVFQSEHS